MLNKWMMLLQTGLHSQAKDQIVHGPFTSIWMELLEVGHEDGI